MPQNDAGSLWGALSGAPHGPDRYIWGVDAHIGLDELLTNSRLGGRLEELCGRSVLVVARDQLSAAVALIEIDGIARRLVLCPPDMDTAHVGPIMARAEIDAVVSDLRPEDLGTPSTGIFIQYTAKAAPRTSARPAPRSTEWVLFTSGTSGVPKMVLHTLSSLAGAIKHGGPLTGARVWSTFYDIRRYGGLQIFLRALLGGGSLVLSSAAESTAEFLARAGSHAVTHITGTPSHWRRALMSGAAHRIAPQYVRLSGEIADQAILDNLRVLYPHAIIAHAFASTEAGVGFEVEDGLAGIPASYFAPGDSGVQLKVEHGSLRIRSARTALRYVGGHGEQLVDDDGYVDTGDILELRDRRYHFVGRRGGIINVGGLKVHPEEVEAVINRHPRVQMSLVKSRRNPVTGAVVVAEIVLKATSGANDANSESSSLKSEILKDCQRALAAHKVPAAIRIVSSLDVTPSGKVARPDA
jgi:acyl-CoA synthetase (AMP-forming)/AMP-acid ligase II